MKKNYPFYALLHENSRMLNQPLLLAMSLFLIFTVGLQAQNLDCIPSNSGNPAFTPGYTGAQEEVNDNPLSNYYDLINYLPNRSFVFQSSKTYQGYTEPLHIIISDTSGNVLADGISPVAWTSPNNSGQIRYTTYTYWNVCYTGPGFQDKFLYSSAILPPTGIFASDITGNSVAINWTHATTQPIEYQVYSEDLSSDLFADYSQLIYPVGATSGNRLTIPIRDYGGIGNKMTYWVRSRTAAGYGLWIYGGQFTYANPLPECAFATYGLFPSAIYSPTCSGSPEVISTHSWAGEFSRVTLQPNKYYTFSSSNPDDYIVITRETGEYLAQGTTPVNYQVTIDNFPFAVRYYLHKGECGVDESVGRVRSVTCSTGPPVCASPTISDVTELGNTTARVGWEHSNPPAQNGYELCFSSDTAPPTAATIGIVGNQRSVLLQDLTPDTTYYYYIRSNCGTSIGDWVFGGSFKTTDDCDRGVYGMYPEYNIIPQCNGIEDSVPPTVISTDTWAGEYYVVEADRFSGYLLYSSNPTDYITVTDENGQFIINGGLSPVYHYNRYDKFRVYNNSSALCGNDQIERTVSMKCTDSGNGTGINYMYVRNLTSSSADVHLSLSTFHPSTQYFYSTDPSQAPVSYLQPPAGTVTVNFPSEYGNFITLAGLTSDTVYYFWTRPYSTLFPASKWSSISFKTKAAGVCYSPVGFSAITITATGATLSWESSTPVPVDGYQYYISSSNVVPTAATVATGTVTNPTVVLSGLNANTIYYYWIRTNCGSGLGAWVGSTFRTAGNGVCATPTPLSTTVISGSGATLNWTAASPTPANGYQYYYSTTNNAPSAATTPSGTVTATSKALTGLNATTTYYFWIRSNCVSGQSNWVSGGSFTTTTSINCTAPSGLNVGSVTPVSAVLSWSNAIPAPANGYQYYLSTSSTTPTAATNPTGGTLTSNITVSGLTASTAYVFWVRSNCGSVQSAWIGGFNFMTMPLQSCDVPSNLSAGAITNNTAQFSWIAPATAPSTGYQLYASTSNVAPPDSVPTTVSIITSTGVTFDGLTASTTYYYWVRSVCGATGSVWVSGGNFITSGSTICNQPILPSKENITTTSVFISWTAPTPVPSNDYQFYYNTTGQVPDDNTIPQGNIATTSFTLSGLSSGTLYFCWIRSNCGSGQSTWRTVGTFTTLSSGCDLPNNLNVYNTFSTSAGIQWNVPATVPSNGYDYYYSASSIAPSAATIPLGNTTIALQELTNLISSTTYYFWVRSNCGAVQTGWVPADAFTTRCSMVTALNDSNPTSNSVLLSWALQYPQAAPAAGYDYYYSTTTSTPSDSAVPSGNVATTSFTLTGLASSTTYYYWVRANCGNSLTFWRFGGSFTTAAPSAVNDTCGNPIALVPATTFTGGAIPGTIFNSTTTAGVTPSCQPQSFSDVWYTVVVPASGLITIETAAAASNSTNDTVIAAFTGNCGSLIEIGCNDDKVSVTDLFSKLTLTGQTPGTLLHVAVWRYGTASAPLAESNFQIAAYSPTLAAESFGENVFTAFPNPVIDYLHLSCSQLISKVKIYNLLGQEVISRAGNSNQLVIDMSHLPSGTYLAKIETGDGVKSVKLLKQ